MFTGIIEEIGTVLTHGKGELILECPLVTSDASLGDSIAVNGVDLTVRSIGEGNLTFDVMNETYNRSNLKYSYERSSMP